MKENKLYKKGVIDGLLIAASAVKEYSEKASDLCASIAKREEDALPCDTCGKVGCNDADCGD